MGEPPAGCARLEDVRGGDAEQNGEISASGGRSRGHDDTQSGELLGQSDAGDGPGRFPAPGAGRLPSATVTPKPPGRTPAGQVSRDPWPFSSAGAGDESGCRRAWHHPPASEAGPRWFKSSHPDCKRKGKPTGDGTRTEPGRATSLEGSTPSPSAERCARGRAAKAPVFQTGQAGSTPAGHSDRRLFDNAADDWPGRQPADHPLREGGMLGVQLPPGPLMDALADQPGVVATPSPWRAWVQIPSRVLTRRVGWALASPSGCNPPAFAVQVRLLADTLRTWPCSSTGRARLS